MYKCIRILLCLPAFFVWIVMFTIALPFALVAFVFFNKDFEHYKRDIKSLMELYKEQTTEFIARMKGDK